MKTENQNDLNPNASTEDETTSPNEQGSGLTSSDENQAVASTKPIRGGTGSTQPV